MSHPKATGDRRSANQKLMIPMRLWYECLKAAEGCYFDPDCRACSMPYETRALDRPEMFRAGALNWPEGRRSPARATQPAIAYYPIHARGKG